MGYDRYGAQGGDWGSSISRRLAQHVPGRAAGLHLNMPMAFASRKDGPLTPDDEAVYAALLRFRDAEGGYSHEQATKPQTLGYGLVDPPAAQWLDPGEVPELDGLRRSPRERAAPRRAARQHLGVLAHRLGGLIGPAVLGELAPNHRDPVGVPTGCSMFPKEIMPAARSAVERRFTDLRYWNELDRGGHVALEQPELFVEELRRFFRLVR